MRSKYLGDSF